MNRILALKKNVKKIEEENAKKAPKFKIEVVHEAGEKMQDIADM